MKLAIFIIVSTCIFAAASAFDSKEPATSAGFRYYLEDVLKGYDSWLKTKHDIHASPPCFKAELVREKVNSSLFNLDYEISCHQMLGYNKAQSRQMEVTVELIDHKISIVTTTVGDIEILGNYTAIGTLHAENGIPLNSSGNWHVAVTSIRDIYSFVLQLGPAGQVIFDIDATYPSPELTTILEIDEDKTIFEGLWEDNEEANRFAPEFRQQMSNEIKKQYESEWYSNWDKHPTGRLMHRFLNETFTNAPFLTDIIKTKNPNADKSSASANVYANKPAAFALGNEETEDSANLRLFLEIALNNYNAWLNSAKGADPSPANQVTDPSDYVGIEISKRLFRFRYMLRYEQMQGFVKDCTERRIEFVTVDLINFRIGVEVVTIGKTVFTGNYSISAAGDFNIGTTIPIMGYGVWNVTSSSIRDVYEYQFNVSSDGYLLVDLDDEENSPTLKSYLDTEDDLTYFEGLWDSNTRVKDFAPEFQFQMSAEIRKRYEDWKESWQTHPSGNLLHRYLNATFTGAPLLQDIMQGNFPKPTTTTTVSTTPLPGSFAPETTTAISGTTSVRAAIIMIFLSIIMPRF